jgi:hypothetical protein
VHTYVGFNPSRPHLFLTRTYIPNGGATGCRGSGGRCGVAKPWTWTTLDKYIANQNVPGVAKEGQPTEGIEMT